MKIEREGEKKTRNKTIRCAHSWSRRQKKTGNDDYYIVARNDQPKNLRVTFCYMPELWMNSSAPSHLNKRKTKNNRHTFLYTQICVCNYFSEFTCHENLVCRCFDGVGTRFAIEFAFWFVAIHNNANTMLWYANFVYLNAFDRNNSLMTVVTFTCYQPNMQIYNVWLSRLAVLAFLSAHHILPNSHVFVIIFDGVRKSSGMLMCNVISLCRLKFSRTDFNAKTAAYSFFSFFYSIVWTMSQKKTNIQHIAQ